MKEVKGNVEMVRLNTRVSSELNDWLDSESVRSGLSKSAIMMIAAENYRREKDTFGMMADLGQLVQKIDQLESVIQRKGLE